MRQFFTNSHEKKIQLMWSLTSFIPFFSYTTHAFSITLKYIVHNIVCSSDLYEVYVENTEKLL